MGGDPESAVKRTLGATMSSAIFPGVRSVRLDSWPTSIKERGMLFLSTAQTKAQGRAS